MKKIFFTLSLIFISTIFLAQAPAFQWAKRMGAIWLDKGNSIVNDAAGNVYTVGEFQDTVDFDPGIGTFTLASSGGPDVFISKLDPNGNLIWAKRIGGFSYDYSHDITIDLSGNVLITGHYINTVDFDPGPGIFTLSSLGPPGNYNVFVLKLDMNGSFLWAKSFGGSNGYSEGWGIKTDATNGDVYITGRFTNTCDFDPSTTTYTLTSLGMDDIFICKLNQNGNFVWACSVGSVSAPDHGIDITTDSQGDVYVTGYFYSNVDFDPGPGTYTLNATGTVGDDIFILKLNSFGNFLWAKKMGSFDYSDRGYSIYADATGVYTTGYFEDVADFDPGPPSYHLTSAGDFDIFISKLSLSGNFLWAKRMGSVNDDGGISITVDNLGGVYTTGYFQSTVDFDPGTSTYTLNCAGLYDAFISKLDGSGNFQWAKDIGGVVYVVSNGISVDPFYNVYTTGSFDTIADFDPGPGIYNMNSAPGGGEDAYIHKMSQTGLSINNHSVDNDILIYPNPANDFINISVEEKEASDYEIEISNPLGQIFITGKSERKINVSKLINGFYYLKIKNSQNETVVKRLVIAR